MKRGREGLSEALTMLRKHEYVPSIDENGEAGKASCPECGGEEPHIVGTPQTWEERERNVPMVWKTVGGHRRECKLNACLLRNPIDTTICADCKKEIMGYTNPLGTKYAPERVSRFGIIDYGIPLCWGCRKNRDELSV